MVMATAVITLFFAAVAESRTASHLIAEYPADYSHHTSSVSTDEMTHIHLEWFYQKERALDIAVPTTAFEDYASRERITEAHSKKYFKTFMTPYDETVKAMAAQLQQMAYEDNLGEKETILLVTRMVQEIPYVTDEKAFGVSQYVQYPSETLVYNEGDCEDTAILAASILQEMGYDVRLAYVDTDKEDHLALAVAVDEDISGRYVRESGKKFYYVETVGHSRGKSVRERPVGVIPDQFATGKMSLIAIV